MSNTDISNNEILEGGCFLDHNPNDKVVVKYFDLGPLNNMNIVLLPSRFARFQLHFRK